MEKEIRTAGREERITLRLNNSLTNDPCKFCGARCDPNGFDFFTEGTEALVCDSCAKKYAPEMVEIQKAALSYTQRDVSLMVGHIQEKIRDVINEPVEKRIMKVLDEILKGKDIPF